MSINNLRIMKEKVQALFLSCFKGMFLSVSDNEVNMKVFKKPFEAVFKQSLGLGRICKGGLSLNGFTECY